MVTKSASYPIAGIRVSTISSEYQAGSVTQVFLIFYAGRQFMITRFRYGAPVKINIGICIIYCLQHCFIHKNSLFLAGIPVWGIGISVPLIIVNWVPGGTGGLLGGGEPVTIIS